MAMMLSASDANNSELNNQQAAKGVRQKMRRSVFEAGTSSKIGQLPAEDASNKHSTKRRSILKKGIERVGSVAHCSSPARDSDSFSTSSDDDNSLFEMDPRMFDFDHAGKLNDSLDLARERVRSSFASSISGPGGNSPSSTVTMEAAISATLDSEDEIDRMIFNLYRPDLLPTLRDALGRDGTNASIGSSTGIDVDVESPYPVGPVTFEECVVCFDFKRLNLRPCCKRPCCGDCLKAYVVSNVLEARIQLECPASQCNTPIPRQEVVNCLDDMQKEKYHRFLIEANREPHIRTCPKCCQAMEVKVEDTKDRQNIKYGLKVLCPKCEMTWCFLCQSPWHDGMKCKDYRKGDVLLKSWAKQFKAGQLNAQRCPKCKIYIQRTSGCDHMQCNQCQVEFCYQCGEVFRGFKFIGDHYSRFSVFGCKYRYKKDKPAMRKFIRGSILAAKILALPLIAAGAVVVGAGIATVGVVALPIYGSYRLHKRLKQRKMARRLMGRRFFDGTEIGYPIPREDISLAFMRPRYNLENLDPEILRQTIQANLATLAFEPTEDEVEELYQRMLSHLPTRRHGLVPQLSVVRNERITLQRTERGSVSSTISNGDKETLSVSRRLSGKKNSQNQDSSDSSVPYASSDGAGPSGPSLNGPNDGGAPRAYIDDEEEEDGVFASSQPFDEIWRVQHEKVLCVESENSTSVQTHL